MRRLRRSRRGLSICSRLWDFFFFLCFPSPSFFLFPLCFGLRGGWELARTGWLYSDRVRLAFGSK